MQIQTFELAALEPLFGSLGLVTSGACERYQDEHKQGCPFLYILGIALQCNSNTPNSLEVDTQPGDSSLLSFFPDDAETL